MEITGIIIALISGGALTALVQQLFLRRKTSADIGRINVDAGVVVFETLKDLITPMREEIRRLAQAHAECQTRLSECQTRLESLTQRLNTLSKRFDI